MQKMQNNGLYRVKRYFNIDQYAKPKKEFDIDIEIAFQSLH